MNDLPILRNMTEEEIQRFNIRFKTKAHSKGEILFREGESGQDMYVIRSGQIKIFKKIKHSDTTFCVLKEGDFFGEMAIIDGGPRSANVEVIQDGELIRIGSKEFYDLRTTDAPLAFKIMDNILRVLSMRLRQANRNLEVIGFWVY